MTAADADPLVQDAACTSVMSLIGIARDRLKPYAWDILKALASLIAKYKAPALSKLYSAIGELIEEVEFSENEDLSLIEAIFERWSNTENTDKILPSITKCIKSSMLRFSSKFEKWAMPVLKRVFSLLQHFIPIINNDIETSAQTSVSDTQIVIISIELLSALCESLGERVEGHLMSIGNGGVIVEACRCRDVQVKQYGCLIIGTLVRTAKEYFKQHLVESALILVSCIECNEAEVVQSCCKSIGDIVLLNPEPSFSCECAKRFAKLLQGGGLNKELGKAVGVAIGKIGLCAPSAVIPHLEAILKPWCKFLKELEDSVEKQQTYKYCLYNHK